MENNEKNIEQISKTIQEMSRCDSTTLAAALAMLPDYMEDGTKAVLGAAARIFAERFTGNLNESMSHFRSVIEENIKEINKDN